MAMACYFTGGDDTPRPVPSFACNYLRHNVYGFVTNTERGDVAVFDVVGRANIDVLDWVPGYSRAQVGSMPEVVVAHPSARWVYTVNRGSSDLSRIDTRPAPEGDYGRRQPGPSPTGPTTS